MDGEQTDPENVRGLAVLAGLAVACGAAPAASAASAAAGYGPHRCYVSDLAVRFHGSQAGRVDVTALARHTRYYP